jgi:hypothetical protein
MMGGESRVSVDRVLDWVVIIVGVASLVMIAYDLNVASLGRRLATETQLWLREQSGRPPVTPPPTPTPEEKAP